ncbi:uncharacterized protein [Amphiura filiformis]|uniref:uncharacterized protein n=1 Tax=Amphiura filiformis TaxID=82378 RepID=UPI003B21B841
MMLFVILFSVCCSLVASEKVLCESGVLGMEDGTITNDQITASSYHIVEHSQISFPPRKARPSDNSYWRPRENTLHMLQDQWIQVDFLETVIITGIQTQGSDSSSNARWISKLQVQTGNSTDNLISITDLLGNLRKFSANTNQGESVNITLPEPISTQYLRIVPTECKNRCGLNFEVFGCRLVNECEEDMDTCGTNADCHDRDNGYECTCKPGFMGNGFQCEDINECASSPCLNGGTCVHDVDGYKCSCADGYMGNLCETSIDKCVSSSCITNETQENTGKQLRKNTSAPGIVAGGVIGGIVLMIMTAKMIVYLIKRHRKHATSSKNPRRDFDDQYDIPQQGNEVALTNRESARYITQDKQSSTPGSPPKSYEDIDGVYHDIQEQNKDNLYSDVDENTKKQDNSYSEVDECRVVNTSDDKSKQNAVKDNNEESGWMDNSVYATSDDNNGETTEGWAENTIYGD